MEKIESSQNFIQMEHDVLKFWEENKCFDALMEKNKENEPFRFLDGPITANNPMGIHHAWGRTLKDVFLRYKAMKGHSCHYRNGFDTQGLWVEVEVEKELGFKSKKDIEDYGMDNFTNRCIERINKFSGVITEQSKRLGQWMDWENSYYTHDDHNITSIWHFLKKCHERGWIGQSHRPMPWCPRCGTSLSEHEMSGSYKEIEHKAVFFKLPLKNKGVKILVWTTTPWTLSSNVALAVNPEIEYCEVKVKSDEQPIILAKGALGVLGDDKINVERVFKGKELIGIEYETCFADFEQQQGFSHQVVAWDQVDPKEGTGVVHIAPGCGAEDYELGKTMNLQVIVPVDDGGHFIDGFGWLTGKNAQQVADLIFEKLEEQSKLYKSHLYSHSYPVCWRCKTEVIFKLVTEWSIKTEEIKPKLIEAANQVKWEPEYNGKRMLDWLSNMGDWNISRKRFYGLPLPFYPCNHCGELTVIGSKEELIQKSENRAKDLPHLHRPWIDDIQIKCSKCGEKVSRIPQVGDVWLDAGIVPFSTLGYFEDKERWKKYYPVQWVTEMREQVRLWFYSLLFMSVVLEDRAPYERVLAYNSVLAEDGTKFSKTGFMIKFEDAAEKIGVDPIRYLFASSNVTNDVRFGYNLGDESRRKLLSFWNVYVFFNTYASIDMPDIANYIVQDEKLSIIDKWMVSRTNQFIENSGKYMEAYQLSSLIKEFENYIDDVSNWYIRLNRRRFWKTEDLEDKKVVYWCLYHSIKATTQIMAPIIPFITEYIWQQMVRVIDPNSTVSVHLSDYPQTLDVNNLGDLTGLIEETSVVRNIIAIALRLRNESQVKVRQPLSKIFIKADDVSKKASNKMLDLIKDELNIKAVEFIEDPSVLDEPYLAVDFKKAGAVLKKDAQKLKAFLEGLDDAQMKDLMHKTDQEEMVEIDGFEQAISRELFAKQTKPKKGIVVGSEGTITVALDLNLNEALIIEGLSREVIRQCQVLRKEANLKVEQRILVHFTSSSDLVMQAVDQYSEHLKDEILANEIKSTMEEPIISKEVEVGDWTLKISIEKA
jgi:isoleucyl-tRNA synthetase